MKDDKPLRVELEEDATELDEVVSYGYYNVDKRHMTSSVTSLKMDDIMMPGVKFGGSNAGGACAGDDFHAEFRDRWVRLQRLRSGERRRFWGSQAPLWVLDGVILSDPVNIDPTSINDLDFVNLLGECYFRY